jgi:hypothetical protein
MKIEKGIPVPKGRGDGITATLRALKVGESVLVPSLNAQVLAARAMGKGKWRSALEGNIRIWRIK